MSLTSTPAIYVDGFKFTLVCINRTLARVRVNLTKARVRVKFKRGFLIGSRRSRDGVSGTSPIWLKFGRVTRGNLKSCQETIF